jgi:serine/threonine protein kinase
MKPQQYPGSPAENKSPPKAFQDGNLISRVPLESGAPSLSLHFPVADQKVPPGSPPTSGVQRWQIRYDELKFEKPALGKGAFGEVFKGTYQKSQVAIKVYDFQGQLGLEEKTMVSKEAEVMEGLRSEYLVSFRGLCLDPRYCLVMEFCDGGTLRARLNQTSQTVTPIEQMRWAMQISYGLYQLHRINILHRDLKGENILLDGRNHAKVADFGLSIVKSSSASHSRSSGGGGRGGAGTLPWMAPELHDDKSNSKETDVYSLGVVLWEIVSRKLPYAGLTAGQMISKTVQDKRDPLPNPCPEVFRLMILACGQLDPNKRPTAEQVGEQFERVLRSAESVPAPLSDSSPKPVQVSSAQEAEMKKLLEKVKQLELEKEEEARRRLQAEKKWEDHARQQAELDRRRGEELKEIQRQPVEPQDNRSTTPLKKEQESKKLTPPSSWGSQSLLPAPRSALKPVDQKDLSQLLRYVAEGEQDKAEALIQKDKNLLLHPGTLKDLSGREFKGITAFQYALWAMDYHMWTMIQKYLPKESQAEQLQVLESKGTAYGKHFSLKELTDALQVYVDNAKTWNYDKRAISQWCQKVGGAQRRLPAHVVNEYCRIDRPFEPCPQEWESKLPRTREVPERWDSKQSKRIKGSWFVDPNSDDSLGFNFAFCRWQVGVDCVFDMGSTSWVNVGAVTDLKALQSLWKTRTQQLESLKSQMPVPKPTASSKQLKLQDQYNYYDYGST